MVNTVLTEYFSGVPPGTLITTSNTSLDYISNTHHANQNFGKFIGLTDGGSVAETRGPAGFGNNYNRGDYAWVLPAGQVGKRVQGAFFFQILGPLTGSDVYVSDQALITTEYCPTVRLRVIGSTGSALDGYGGSVTSCRIYTPIGQVGPNLADNFTVPTNTDAGGGGTFLIEFTSEGGAGSPIEMSVYYGLLDFHWNGFSPEGPTALWDIPTLSLDTGAWFGSWFSSGTANRANGYTCYLNTAYFEYGPPPGVGVLKVFTDDGWVLA